MRVSKHSGFLDIRGLSTDTKPTQSVDISGQSSSTFVGVGDTFLEADTGKMFIFDGQAWKEL